MELSKIRERLQDRGFHLELSEKAVEFLIVKGTNLDMGARPMRRALENYIEDPLSEELLQGSFEGKNKIQVDVVYNEDNTRVKHLKFEGMLDESLNESTPVGVAGGGDDSSSSED